MMKSFSEMTTSELKQFIRKNYTIANKRIKRLEEKYSGSSAYNYLKRKSVTKNYLSRKKSDTKTGYTIRFSPPKKQTRQQLLSEAVMIRGFIDARTSTITGVKKKFAKAVDTLNANHKGLNLSIEDASNIFENEVFQKYKNNAVGSDAILQILQNNSNDDTISDILEDYFSNGGNSLVGLQGILNSKGFNSSIDLL